MQLACNLNWTMTDQLIPDEVTEFVAYVDYVGATKRMKGKKIATFQYKVRNTG